jgi:hypothetical protein
LKAVHHILVSSAETRRAFNSGFDRVYLHRPTSNCTVISFCQKGAGDKDFGV